MAAPGLYLHVPFCSAICPCCDFSVLKAGRPARKRFVQHLVAEAPIAARAWVEARPFDTVYFGLAAERQEIGTVIGIPLAYLNYRVIYGEQSLAFPLTIGWARDGRDSLLVPTRGRYQRVNLEWSFAGDVRYTRTNFQHQE